MVRGNGILETVDDPLRDLQLPACKNSRDEEPMAISRSEVPDSKRDCAASAEFVAEIRNDRHPVHILTHRAKLRRVAARILLCLVVPSAAPAVADPTEERIEEQFAFGMAAAHHGRLDDAIQAFHAILAEVPDRHRVRLELARAFYLKGDDRLARQQFERVLAAASIPPAVKRNVMGFLAAIRARKKWTFDFGFAVAPTTNITNESGHDTIDIFGLPFTRDGGAKVESGVGLKSWIGGDYRKPVSRKMQLRSGIGISRSEYRGGRFDRMGLNAYWGARWLFDGKTEASLLLVADQSWSGSVPTSRNHGVRIEARRSLSNRTVVRATGQYGRQDYRLEPDLDGPLKTVVLDGTWRASPVWRLTAEWLWQRNLPYGRIRERSVRRRLAFGASADLPRGFTLSGKAALSRTDFSGDWFPLVTETGSREDRTRTLEIGIHKRDFTFRGFSPRMTVTREIRSSNSQIHGFQSTGVEVSFVRQW